jgi:hypothetical protein
MWRGPIVLTENLGLPAVLKHVLHQYSQSIFPYILFSNFQYMSPTTNENDYLTPDWGGRIPDETFEMHFICRRYKPNRNSGVHVRIIYLISPGIDM